MVRRVRRSFGAPAVCGVLGLLTAVLAATPGIDPGPAVEVTRVAAVRATVPAQPPPPVPPPNPGD